MKLYGSFTSPFVRHCRIALLETKTPFEFIETDNAKSAAKSPTKRVPFLEDGEVFLTDSNSIIKYIREKAGQPFLTTVNEFEQYFLINTALDSALNLMFLEKDGIDIQAYGYLKRQTARIESALTEIDQFILLEAAPYNDVELRLACFINWAKFRNRVDFSKYNNVENFYSGIQNYEIFKATVPPT